MAFKAKVLGLLSRRALWAGTLIFSSASAASAVGIAPLPSDPETWVDARRELGADPADAAMSQSLARLLDRLRDGDDERHLMALSYSSARPEDLTALDEFWTRYLTRRRDNAGFVTLMRVRAQVLGNAAADRETYLENWLYLAGRGNYDCGGGGGNCGVGVGNGGGDGTTNEGNSGQPDGDGDQGGGNNGRPGNV